MRVPMRLRRRPSAEAATALLLTTTDVKSIQRMFDEY